MSWTWAIDSGSLYDKNGELQGKGYAGGDCGAYPPGVNNPSCCDVPKVGPLPPGHYTIGAPQDTITHGPYVLPLTPNPGNQMYGRGGFLIHGDSILAPGRQEASEGCIVLPLGVREQIWNSGDHDLGVVASYDPPQPSAGSGAVGGS